MLLRLILFLVLNFGALAIGGFFTGKGVSSEWYFNLSKAPWTPPGWVFGAAWTTIMICFSIYLTQLWPSLKSPSFFIGLFGIQWLLNVAWNPVFFYYRNTVLGLVLISALTLIVFAFLIIYWQQLKLTSLLIAPYAIWLLIATSLNAYIMLKN